MDLFVEQLIKKEATILDNVKRIGILLLTVILSGFFLMVAWLFAAYYLIILVAGTVYLAAFVLKGTVTEYEYILTNRDLDVDKIIGQRKRKRLITIKLDKAEYFGPYDEKIAGAVSATVIADNATGKNLYCLVTNHAEHGKIALLFNPNKKLTEAIQSALPIALRRT